MRGRDFRWLVPALVVPLCIVGLGFAVQAAAFRTPSRDSLTAANALRQLAYYDVMRGVEQIDGRRLASTCVEGWYRAHDHGRLVPGAIVLLGNGERLFDLGSGVHVLGRRGVTHRIDRLRFVLAGCPEYIGSQIGNELVRGTSVEADPGSADGTRALELGFLLHRHQPLDLYVQASSDLPIELRFAAGPRGWSDLQPGGSAQAVVRVRHAFGLGKGHQTLHA